MVCQSCGRREAALLVHTVVVNHVRKAALCSTCAGELGSAGALDALMQALGQFAGKSRAHPGRCPGCRASFADFRRSGRFGCPRCYDAFTRQVNDLLPRIHGGAYHHRGKTPGRR